MNPAEELCLYKYEKDSGESEPSVKGLMFEWKKSRHGLSQCTVIHLFPFVLENMLNCGRVSYVYVYTHTHTHTC